MPRVGRTRPPAERGARKKTWERRRGLGVTSDGDLRALFEDRRSAAIEQQDGGGAAAAASPAVEIRAAAKRVLLA